MTEYEYTREVVPGDSRWDIDDSIKINGSGDQVRLTEEILTALPGKSFTMKCNSSIAIFNFTQSLTTGEKQTLDTIIATNKTYEFAVIDQTPNEAVIKSPDGTKWKITVDDTGILTTEQVQ